MEDGRLDIVNQLSPTVCFDWMSPDQAFPSVYIAVTRNSPGPRADRPSHSFCSETIIRQDPK